MLEDKGYIVDYTLNAFDNLVQSLEISKLRSLIILIVFFIIAIINMIISFLMYINNSQKDMGILRHLKKCLNKDVLQLLKFSKENE